MASLMQSHDGWNERPKDWEAIPEEVNEGDLSTEADVSPRVDAQILSGFEGKQYDVILVLAGGLDDKGHCHPWVKRRLDLAVKFWHRDPSRYIVCLGGGTYHKAPFLNHANFVVHESTACADYLMRVHHVPGRQILKEWASFDTIANAFFALTNHVIPRRWNRILVITSDFHLPRSRKIFDWVFGLDDSRSYRIDYAAHSDIGFDEETISARREREQASMNNLERNIQRITTMDDFHTWFFTEHRAYNCVLEHEKVHEVIDERTRRSY